MRSSWDLSYLLSLQEAMIMFMRMKMSHRLHIVALFRDGLIRLVVTLSGRMIRLMVSISSKDFLPPTHLHEFHFMIDYISIYAHDHLCLTYLCCFT
jgi:hypothetical protein